MKLTYIIAALIVSVNSLEFWNSFKIDLFTQDSSLYSKNKKMKGNLYDECSNYRTASFYTRLLLSALTLPIFSWLSTRHINNENCESSKRELVTEKCKYMNVISQKRQKRIVGGSKTETSAFKHMAKIFTKRISKVTVCGGSLITEDFVLTAAHCFHENKSRILIYLGQQLVPNRDSTTSMQTFYAIEKYVHPDFNSSFAFYSDIGLLKLHAPAVLNAFVYPACLPTRTKHISNISSAILTGWGVTNPHTKKLPKEKTAHKISLSIVESNECNTQLLNMKNNTNFVRAFPAGIKGQVQICAGAYEKGACYGDSGSPFQIERIYEDKAYYEIIGITSYGSNLCGLDGVPTVFVKVYAFLDWIEDILWHKSI